MPAVTSELFGLENFATNYAIIMLGPAAGAAETGAALCCISVNRGTMCPVSRNLLPMAAYSRMLVSQACWLNRHACSPRGQSTA